MKRRVAIVYSGQTRTNALNSSYKKDNVILDATNKYFLNDEFKSKYEYDVFISTDGIDITKAKEFFGSNLKNINITKEDFYLNKIDTSNVKPYEYYYNRYQEKTKDAKYNGQPVPNYIQNLHQYYRMYCGYNMLIQYQRATSTKYDYIIRIRPDSRIMRNISTLMNILDTTDAQVITEHDQLTIFKYNLVDILKLITCYGDYVDDKDLTKYKFMNASGNIGLRDFLAPERNYVNHIFHVISKNNLEWNKSFIGILYPSYHLLYREDGSHAYSNYSDKSGLEWDPTQKSVIYIGREIAV